MTKGTYYRRKVDNNQKEIVDALRQIPGLTVKSTAALGKGFPDIAVGYKGRNYFFEIKATHKDTLTPDEEKWHGFWRGHVQVARSAREILESLGIGEEICR